MSNDNTQTRTRGEWLAPRPGRYLGLMLAVLVTVDAEASETTIEPYAESSIRYESNLFRVDSNADVPIIDGKQSRDDFIVDNIVGVKASYLYSKQTFRGTAEGRRFDYLNVSRFDHYEYTVSGGYDYSILSRVNGTIDYQETRRQSQFVDRNIGPIASQLNFDKDRSGGISSNFLVANDFRLSSGYHLHSLKTPVIGAPSLRLSDQTANSQLDYTGISRFSAGIAGSYVDGRYSGIAITNRFNQYGAGLAFAYDATDLTKVNFNIGYTERKDRGLDSTSGITGDLAILRDFTVKTSGSLDVFRRFTSYTAGDNTVVETGARLGLTWQATERFASVLGYEFTRASFQNQGLPGAFEENRKDQSSSITLTLTYQLLTWLELFASTSYQTRKSTLENDSFNDGSHSLRIRATF